LFLPELPRPAQELVCPGRRAGLPRVQDVGKRVLHDRSKERMDMVGHHDIAAQHVALAVEMFQSAFNKFANLSLRKLALSVALIQFLFLPLPEKIVQLFPPFRRELAWITAQPLLALAP